MLKGGYPSNANNYGPIFKLPILAKVYESPSELTELNVLIEKNILRGVESGFRSGHSTTTAAMAVANYIINALDKKQHCAALLVDLSKAFDSVDHELLLARLRNIGLSEGAVNWFRNYRSNRTQCTAP